MVIALLLTGVTHGMLPQEYLDLSFSEVLSNSHVFALGKTTLTRGLGSNVQIQYGKILKISPWAYIFFQSSFWGVYLWREICVSNLIRLALYLEVNLPFLLYFLCIWGPFSKYKPLGSLYLEGQFNRGFFVLLVWGAFIWRGSFSEFYGMPKNTVSRNTP